MLTRSDVIGAIDAVVLRFRSKFVGGKALLVTPKMVQAGWNNLADEIESSADSISESQLKILASCSKS